MFIIDLDDTLLDTQAFKQARINALQSVGISEDLYKKSYQEAYTDPSGANVYSSANHAEILATYGFDKKEVLDALQQTEFNLKNLLFAEVKNVLSFLKERRQKLILLSLGEESFQKMKIMQTGLDIYFDLIFTVNDSKERIIQKILDDFPNEEAWLINDKIEETKKINRLFPNLKSILKMSPQFSEADYRATNIPYFKTLTEIKQYVQQHLV